MQMSYTVTSAPVAEKLEEKKGETYSYTIQF